jgi:predicted amidohydrolase YtcJ
MEHKKGLLQPGLLADVTVLTGDIECTDGRVVFQL